MAKRVPILAVSLMLVLLAVGCGSSSTVEQTQTYGAQSDEVGEPTTSTSTAIATSASTAISAVPTSVGRLIEPGQYGSFTSPSGNIACVIDEMFGASCWIGEKQWTVDEPTAADCDGFDFGNAVDVTESGIEWPCYSDFSWDPSAPALAYGDRMRVGGYDCASAEDGVTCRNAAGQGFRVARAAVETF